jgi:hypothetical protein
MRELVEEHSATPVVAPTIGVAREDYCWIEQSTSERHRYGIAAEKTRRVREVEPVGYLPEGSRPLVALERPRPANYSRYGNHSQQQTREEDERADRPACGDEGPDVLRAEAIE